MNTPKTRKRHAPKFPDLKSGAMAGGGAYAVALLNPEFAARLGYIASEFEHLEDEMAKVLAILLNDSEDTTAGYLLRALKAPRARFDLMHNLLTLAPQNKELGDEYDAIIQEFWDVGRERNKYVHGRWYTRDTDSAVFFSAVDEHGWTFVRTREATTDELDALVNRIGTLRREIVSVAHLDLLKRRKQHATPPQPDSSRRLVKVRPKDAATAPPPPPQSSGASPRKKRTPKG
jgi:hypothetical protein